jgi:DNA-directed RNA polymerase specialized sigma24 family protein
MSGPGEVTALLRGERRGHTFQPTALVHEPFLRLVDQNRADWQNRAQFVGVDAQLMRRLLVDHARGRRALKRGIPFTLNEEILELPAEARLGELRYFGGLSVEETAEALAISPRTVKRDWAMAKAWLKTQQDSGRPA